MGHSSHSNDNISFCITEIGEKREAVFETIATKYTDYNVA